MVTEDLDIVYTIKADCKTDELKYSLRSLKNLLHNKVWIYGGCPDFVDNAIHIGLKQEGNSKWEKTSSLLRAICWNDEITEDFIWFHDDFFVLKEMTELPYYKDRTLDRRTLDFWEKSVWVGNGRYPRRLKLASRALKLNGLSTDNYELHLPMIFNRQKLKEIFELYPNIGAKRSLYGNTFVKDATERADVKIYNLDEKPDKAWDFVSTSDLSFREGAVGKYVRNKFKKKGAYEK